MNEGVMDDGISSTARLKQREQRRLLIAALGLAILAVFLWNKFR